MKFRIGFAVIQPPRKRAGPPESPAYAYEGKNGHGAGSAMDQIARDRLVTAREATLSTEEQIKGLWRLRVPQDRTIDGLWTLQAWLCEHAPDLLENKRDSFQYLLALLSNEMATGAVSR